MVYDPTKPHGEDSLRISDDTIRANFLQTVANFSNEHQWDNSTAANVVHNRACGIISRDLSVEGSPNVLGIVDESLSFTPNIITFDFFMAPGTSAMISGGFGKYSEIVGDSVGFWVESVDFWRQFEGAGTQSVVALFDTGGDFQSATCTIDTNKFTLVWSKYGSPTGTGYIRYTAYG